MKASLQRRLAAFDVLFGMFALIALSGCQNKQTEFPELLPERLPNPLYAKTSAQAATMYVSTGVLGGRGRLLEPVRISDAKLANRINVRMTSCQWLLPIREVTWANHMFIVLCDAEGKPIRAVMSDCGRSSFYSATPKLRGSWPYVISIKNKPFYGKLWAAQKEPTSFHYAVPARDLIIEVESLVQTRQTP